MTGQVELASVGEREAVLALHRAGELERSRAGYERLLTAAPEDADLLGLLGVVALQQQHAAEAEVLLRRAIHVPHRDPRVHLRNVNNLFVLFHEQGRAEAAAELAGAELPDWPADAPPDAAEQVRRCGSYRLRRRGRRPGAAGRRRRSISHHGARGRRRRSWS